MIKAKLYLSLSSIIRVKSIFWLLYLYIIKIWNNGIFVAPHKQLEIIILSCWYVVVGKIDYLKYLLVGKMVPHNIYSRIYKYVCFWKKKKKLDLQEEGVMGVWLVGLSELSVFTCPLFLCTWVGGSTHVAHTLHICDDNRECDLTSLFHVTSSLLSPTLLSSPLSHTFWVSKQTLTHPFWYAFPIFHTPLYTRVLCVHGFLWLPLVFCLPVPIPLFSSPSQLNT